MSRTSICLQAPIRGAFIVTPKGRNPADDDGYGVNFKISSDADAFVFMLVELDTRRDIAFNIDHINKHFPDHPSMKMADFFYSLPDEILFQSLFDITMPNLSDFFEIVLGCFLDGCEILNMNDIQTGHIRTEIRQIHLLYSEIHDELSDEMSEPEKLQHLLPDIKRDLNGIAPPTCPPFFVTLVRDPVVNETHDLAQDILATFFDKKSMVLDPIKSLLKEQRAAVDINFEKLSRLKRAHLKVIK